jgi:AraC-like DNA-binding protein
VTLSATREQRSVRNLLDSLKKAARFNSGMVISVVPRGGLQIVQPSNVPDSILKAYAHGLSDDDRLSWQTIIKRKPMRASDAYPRAGFDDTAYATEVLASGDLKFALALPLVGPVLAGYPGVVHLFRTEDKGDFTAKEIDAMMRVVHQFDEKRVPAKKSSRRTSTSAAAVSFVIVDSKLKPVLNGDGFSALDGHLRQQLLDQAKRRMTQVNGHNTGGDRVQIPDSHGDVWIFRLVAFRKFPALGAGGFTFFCRQPSCSDWAALKPQDFQADAELARLIPSLKFMQNEFHRGPTLVEIARQVHLSPFHFHRRFTELLGLTPKQFMLECQINEAKSELLTNGKDLVAIARDCGFAHQSHFTSRFKQTTGLTPTRWRRMAQERDASSN